MNDTTRSSPDVARRAWPLHELALDAPPSAATLQALTRLAASHAGCATAALELIDGEGLRVIAALGDMTASSAAWREAVASSLAAIDDVIVRAERTTRSEAARTRHADHAQPLFFASAALTIDGRRAGLLWCADDAPHEPAPDLPQSLRDLAQVASAWLGERLAAQRARTYSPGSEAVADPAMLAAEERWRLAVESGGQGVWDWDARKKGLYFSEAWKAIIGYDGHEIGTQLREWLSRIHPDDLGPAKAKLVAHLRGETPLYTAEHRMRHKHGHDVWVRNSGKVVRRAKSGRALRMVGTLVDVTSQRQADTTLRNQRAAELAHVAKSEFLSRMSHEMRTPLNAVIGFAQLLLSRPEAPDPKEVRDYAEHVLRAGEHLLNLTNDVLDLQHVEEGRVDLDMEDVPLERVVASVIDQLAAAAQERGVSFDNHVGDGIAVRADERRLRQVLHNIASNAVKYNRPAGTVRWSLERGAADDRVRLSVEDSGSGLKPAQLERLFQPFERLGRETSTIEGTGLGLIIARSLARAMGATLHVASAAGVGTRVVIDLPIARQSLLPFTQPAELDVAEAETDPVQTPRAPDAPAIRPSPALRMLYVEDNRINAILFEEAIRLRDDVELRVADDGTEALDQVRDWRPDVLVLDAHLPGIDGFALLNVLRAQPGLGQVPAFMCSADAMPDDMERAAHAGFAGYWSKPINIAKIMSDLDRISAGLSSMPAGQANPEAGR
jgi:PAS domain S-box-containing protein